ncbi:MAG: DNA internalization-related competence protein ComEC/Rec2 [Lachnospiraceae bacterium]|nr:DNA internalization-related competence protein ComEC/Rec2 [Lachnospiraceae bacterium]
MKRPACVVGFCLLFFLGLLYYLKPPESSLPDELSGEEAVLEGIIDDKYHKNSDTYLTVKDAGFISGIRSEDRYKITVKLKNNIERLAEALPIGTRVRINGKLFIFPGARNPGNFDQASYQKARGIDFEIYGATVSGVQGGRENPVEEGMCLLREELAACIDRLYGTDDSGIIKAMLLGDRSGLTEEIRSGYRRSGMSHILCISALHITLLGMGVLKLISRTGLNKTASYLITFFLILLYGSFTGAGVSTLRAVITFGLMIMADIVGRTPDLLSSMSVAGTVMLLFRPVYVTDAGFILSYTAVCGIGILVPAIKKILPAKGGFFESLRASMSITIFMFPVTLYFFFRVPLYSTVINLAAIPLLGVLLVSSLISVVIGFYFPFPGSFAAIPAKLVLRIYAGLTEFNDGLPFSLITLGRPEMWQCVIYYILIITAVLIVERKSGTGFFERVFFMTAVVAAMCIQTYHIRPVLAITMIDVGQGDCHLLEIKGGKTVMIDCGSSDVDRVAEYRVKPYVLSRGIDTIDYAVVTHTDEDHINGYMEMLEDSGYGGIRIKVLIMPDIGSKDENYAALVKAAKRRGTEIRTIKTGDIFNVSGVRFECLNPAKGRIYDDCNASSVCLEAGLTDTSIRALFTGDVQGKGEQDLIALLRERAGMSKRRYTLLKCAHHGSANSTPMEFLSLTGPVFTFISAGVDNRYGHPDELLTKRLEKSGTRIYVTKEMGAVRFDTDGQKVKITHFIDKS